MEPITSGAITLGVTAYAVALMVARHRRHQHVQSSFCLPEPRYIPPMPRIAEPRAAQTWRTSCEGCGAAVQRHETQCSYCLRSTAAVELDAAREMLDVTTMEDVEPRYVTGWHGPR